MFEALLERLIVKLVKTGNLSVSLPSGKTIQSGDPSAREVSIALHDPALPRKLILNPELALGEAYMDETLTIEKGDLVDLLTLLIRNNRRGNLPGWQRVAMALRKAKRRIDQLNPRDRAQHNARFHYDINLDFYDLWLGRDRLYSCAYYANLDWDLDTAQDAKKDLIARKMMVKPGMRVLDIGCGWGEFSIMLARDYGAKVVGINLSEQQCQIARDRAVEEGVADLVEFRCCDYREVDGEFDRIVCIGMMEHVGQPQYKYYFGQWKKLLADDGIGFVHYIGRSTPPDTLSPWFQKYIFPGGYCPSFSEVVCELEKLDLIMTDVEVLRGHYERTLRHWRENFEANLDEVRENYDERFIRMWRYYLIACELSFTEMKHQVFHLQVTKREDAVPLTRDYLYEAHEAQVENIRAAE